MVLLIEGSPLVVIIVLANVHAPNSCPGIMFGFYFIFVDPMIIYEYIGPFCFPIRVVSSGVNGKITTPLRHF